MKNRILLLLIIVFSSTVYAKPKIITSITPLASIISMITEDAAEIVTINVSSGCPHHYQLRPSDKEKVKNAQIFIYIDNHFDGFAAKLASNFQGKLVKLNELKSLNFLDEAGKKNWHFWLDLNNVLALQEELSEILLKEFPELEHTLTASSTKAKEKINSLMQLKQQVLESNTELVVLSDSLEHFFARGQGGKIIKLYQRANPSLKDFGKLEDILNTETPQCILIDASVDPSIYKKFNKKIIQLESENWPVDNDIVGNGDLFYNKYMQMINQLKQCQ